MNASILKSGDKFKLTKYHMGLERGFLGVFRGVYEYYDGEKMLQIYEAYFEDEQPYLIRQSADIELVTEEPDEQAQETEATHHRPEV